MAHLVPGEDIKQDLGEVSKTSLYSTNETSPLLLMTLACDEKKKLLFRLKEFIERLVIPGDM